jgi:hypothetical protein
VSLPDPACSHRLVERGKPVSTAEPNFFRAVRCRREFDGIVTHAAAEGDLRADVEPATVTRLLFGMVNSLIDWYGPAAVSLPPASPAP